MIGEQQQPAGPQHPGHLLHGFAVIGNRAQRERADDAVEAGIGKLQRLRVAVAQLHRPAQPPGPVPGDIQHRRAPLHPGQLYAVRVVGQVEAGADRHLQDTPGRPGADPVAAAGEHVPVEESHLLVIGARVLVPVAAQPLLTAWLPHSLSLSWKLATAAAHAGLPGRLCRTSQLRWQVMLCGRRL
jgi:hypothetical protein